MSDNDNDFTTFLAGFLIGGLVGAGVSLILAPQSGQETRKYIADKSIELKTTAQETAEEARQRAEEAAKHARARAEEAAHLAKERATELAAKGQETYSQTRDMVKKSVQNGVDSVRKATAKTDPEEPVQSEG